MVCVRLKWLLEPISTKETVPVLTDRVVTKRLGFPARPGPGTRRAAGAATVRTSRRSKLDWKSTASATLRRGAHGPGSRRRRQPAFAGIEASRTGQQTGNRRRAARPETGHGVGKMSPPARRVVDEPAPKTDSESDPQSGGSAPAKRRTFNESAHKVPYWHGNYGVRQAPAQAMDGDGHLAPRSDQDTDVVAHAGRAVLALGALGVVYGDIGTSPLYAEQTIFLDHPHAATINPVGVYGMVSLIFWALTIVVSIKYAGFIMRAHNRGDGGIMALAALLQRKRVAKAAALVTLGVFGAALFFGDGMITPAISVLSAIEGLKVVDPALSHLVVPISVAILLVLFGVQRFGTEIGRASC